MRFASLMVSATLLLWAACATAPLSDRADGHFDGHVTSTRQVGIEQDWALWAADIRLTRKQNQSDVDQVVAYYFQNLITNYVVVEGTTTSYRGHSHSLSCPGWPVIRTNADYRFYFNRRDLGDRKHILLIKEAWSK